ncbi:hypothetical protein CSA56_18970 [candidate division KSB3 bacterium]|uniref:Uncharacterized protein n=1 Tax=candidate division KSB3 bacterium TaxID=2044937 RepID=A0A2G6K6E1_9BACT|nr:MAG: hypothetical protein CSA56_18970 [candidate division KSB3 bacterium]
MPGVQAIQQQIVDYLNAPEVKALPVIRDRQFAVELLAGGESNVMTDLRHRNTVVNIPWIVGTM